MLLKHYSVCPSINGDTKSRNRHKEGLNSLPRARWNEKAQHLCFVCFQEGGAETTQEGHSFPKRSLSMDYCQTCSKMGCQESWGREDVTAKAGRGQMCPWEPPGLQEQRQEPRAQRREAQHPTRPRRTTVRQAHTQPGNVSSTGRPSSRRDTQPPHSRKHLTSTAIDEATLSSGIFPAPCTLHFHPSYLQRVIQNV